MHLNVNTDHNVITKSDRIHVKARKAHETNYSTHMK